MHRHYCINIMIIIYLCIIYFIYSFSKWSTIFKYYFFIVIIQGCTYACCVWDCYRSFNLYVCIFIITLIWRYHWCFRFNLITDVIRCTWFIICFNPFFCPKFKWLIWCIIQRIVLFFDIVLLYFCVNLTSLIIYCIFSGDIYLSLCTFSSFVTVSELFCNEDSAVFWIVLFEAFFTCICNRLFSMINRFLAVFTTYFFTHIFTHISSKRQKSITFSKYSISMLNWIACRFLYMLYFD